MNPVLSSQWYLNKLYLIYITASFYKRPLLPRSPASLLIFPVSGHFRIIGPSTSSTQKFVSEGGFSEASIRRILWNAIKNKDGLGEQLDIKEYPAPLQAIKTITAAWKEWSLEDR